MAIPGARLALPTNPPKKHIGTTTAVIVVTLALFLDGLQFFLTLLQGMMSAVSLSLVGIPFLAIGGLAFVGAWIVSALSFIAFGFFFVFSGIRFFEGRERLGKTFGLMGAVAIELLPLLNILPSITIWVLTTVLATFKEDQRRMMHYKEQLRAQAAAAATPLAANDNEPRAGREIPRNQNRPA